MIDYPHKRQIPALLCLADTRAQAHRSHSGFFFFFFAAGGIEIDWLVGLFVGKFLGMSLARQGYGG